MTLTIEEELDLIKDRRQAPAPAAAPPAAPRPKTPEEIDAELGLPPAATGLAPPPEFADTWDVISAAWRAETIRTDAWNDTASRRRALADEMWGLLDRDGQNRVWKARVRHGWSSMEALIVAEVARQSAISPEMARVFAGYPLSAEDFDRQINAGRLADLNQAQAVLDQSGGGFAEFAGSAARAMTDQTSVMLLPFGLSGSAWRMIAGEALLGAAGEAAVLPREFKVAEELGLPDPDPLSRIGLGAVVGGGLPAAILGLGKGLSALKSRVTARRASLDETLPPDANRVVHEAEVEAAEGALRGDRTVEETFGGYEGGARAEAPPRRGRAPEPVVFDYAAGGAADPATNLVGYTVGKLIDRGMDPHIALGFVSNFMAESGRGLNTGAIGDGGNAFGIAQWNGRRRAALVDYAEVRGRNWRDIDLQIDFLFHELNGSEARAWASIRGATTAEEAARLVSNLFERPGIPHLGTRVAYARMLASQYAEGKVPRAGDPGQWHTGGEDTSRGYTGRGQVAVGDDMRIDVDWEVADLSSLTRASGDLQPRDRSRIASDAWVAETAAGLDPARLMPAPTADRGAPIVGPDSVIESGNGRVMAIARAYERHPDRALAYRAMIEAEGFTVPEGVERPVLIARRRTGLDEGQRRKLVIAAQDSGVAQMTPTELAQVAARGMSAPVLAQLDIAQPLASKANGGFVRAALATLPRSARNAMFDAGGALNAAGARQLREALFARAWPDPDILARYAEGGATEVKSLIEALESAAPAWAALKADIEAGLVRPEMDIGGFVLDAMRLIAAARDLARRQGMPIATAIAELLDEVDLIQGAIAPLTAALVRKFWRNGRAAPADEVAEFLTRYAVDARKAGATGGMFDAPGPRDVLRAIDPRGFADLPDNLGRARGFATRPATEAPPEAVAARSEEDFDQGAQSPAAAEVGADLMAELRGEAGPFGPVFTGLTNNPEGAIARIMEAGDGEVADAFVHPQLGPIALVHGKLHPDAPSRDYGLIHILQKHGREMLDSLPDALRNGIAGEPVNGRIYLDVPGDPLRRTVVKLQWNDQAKQWVASSHLRPSQGARQLRTTDVPAASASPRVPDATGQTQDTASPAGAQPPENPAPIDMAGLADMQAGRDIARARSDLREFAEVEIDQPDGSTIRAADVLDELDADRAADAVLQACGITPGGAT